MALNFNAEPYFDDYNEDDKFYRVLFRPGYAVQARELTQLQTILQNQITKFGSHIFKEGSMVIPGQISVDTDIGYVKLQPVYGTTAVSGFLSNLDGLIVVGQTSGVRALVKTSSTATSTDSNTIFVKYLDSGTDNATKIFADNEVIAPETGSASYTVQAISSSATGVGSIASVQRGVYFVKGTFCIVSTQNLILDKYANSPSYRVGLDITETFVDSDDDISLLDNAQGSYNYAAPGADRYKIDLTLKKLTLASTDDEDFVELVRIENGTIQHKIERTDYSLLEETLARRTFDESGNYTVSPFKIDVREHRNNDRGAWAASRAYTIGDIVTNGGNYYVARTTGTSASSGPSHTIGEGTDGAGGVTWLYDPYPKFNRGIYDALDTTTPGDSTKLAIGMEPGKAYVRGYEIEKIATEYLPFDKTRDYANATNAKINATVGNYILITNLHAVPPIEEFSVIELYDELIASGGSSSGTQIGTARVRGVEYHSGTIGTTTAVYKLQLFDVDVTSGYDFNQSLKSVYYNTGSATTSFTADISPVNVQLTGSVTASASTTITGTGTLFESELVVGDFITFAGTSIQRKVVTITDNNTIVIAGSAVTVTGAVVYKLTTELKEPDNSTLLFQFPYEYIKEARDSLGVNAISYTVAQRFTGTTSGSGLLTLAVTGGNDTFASEADSDNYLVVRSDTGEIIAPSSITRTVGNTQVEIQTSVNSTAMVVIAAVNRTGSGTEKTKTLTTVTGQTLTSKAAATKSEIILGKADGYRLLSVLMDTGTFAAPTGTYSIDITNRYTFDDGQYLTYYDVAKIILNDGSPAPTAPISIAYQYFAHSGSGDYFTVNSYTSTISYSEIPFGLTDFIDFRPRIDDDGTDFTTTGSSPSLLPKRGIDVEADFSYYLPRKDKISVDVNGNFFITSGVSNLNPGEPNDPTLAMVLYKLDTKPYTSTTSDVEVIYMDNKRYTMRDIGAIEKRISNLEYYTSLSLLESETKSLTLLDNNGLDRFKNGFFVDNFTSQASGDPTSIDWSCSLDMEEGVLRPFYTMDNINMIELNTLDADRTSDGYQVTGDLVTLPYTHTELIEQKYASRTENINPFAIFTFLGRTDLNPASDEWIDVKRQPDIVNDVEGNFSALTTILEERGVLGTSWNAWQNNWTGAWESQGRRSQSWNLYLVLLHQGNAARARVRREVNREFGARGGGPWVRSITSEVLAREVGQSRTGIKTSVAAKIDKQLVEDKVLSTAVIPYIRSRNLLFSTHGLKPETQFYPFFDDVDISTYITPATKITYTELSSYSTEFDHDTNSGGDASETARTISDNVEVSLNKGDIVYVGTRSSTNYTKDTSPATAVCVYRTDFDGTLTLHVVNIKGSFADGDVIVGTISGARGTISGTPTAASLGDNLVTNEAGDLLGLFDIPNTNSMRFRTGTREFKLIDDQNNIISGSTSRSRAQYRAQGILETRQATYNAVRNGEVVTEAVTETRTITETTRRVISDTGWYDPLAQSFLVDQPGGAFLTKVDIYFATKDDTIPVQLQIREMVNGFPGKNILPFSRTYKPASEINISTSTVSVNGETYFAPDTATTFTFPSPVYVEEGTEYCICLVSDSNNYNVWISQLGEQNAGSQRYISEQPYAGVLFKSQNASTWTADQMQDLKFTIYRAVFDTAVTGEVEFVNDKLSIETLGLDPIQTANGSGKIRVFHNAHGMSAGDSVTIANATAVNGLTTGDLNATHTIDSVEIDSYIISTGGGATATGFGGGTEVTATRNIAYQTIQPIVAYQSFSDTTFNTELKTVTGTSVDGIETAYTQSSYFGVVPNDNNYLDYNALAASEINETNNLSGDKSLYMKAILTSTNDSLSPVIDMDRMSMIAVRNQVNNPSSSYNDSVLDVNDVITANANVAASGSVISSADSSTQDLLKTIKVGKYITTTGFSNAANNDTFLVTAVDSSNGDVTVSGSLTTEAAGSSVSIDLLERYVDEIAPINSSTDSKYITRKINLENPSTFIKVRMAVDLPPNAGLDVYYKNSLVGSNKNFDTIKYTLVSPDETIIQNNDGLFYDVEYTLESLEPFDATKFKLVFTSTEAQNVARVKDLRIIACA